ncbi:MAG: beta-lactamase family protein, partial [Candidatus Aminicenantes bacterium]|nr:beta-lactamase family protein [Candidatus Aminicenantes bacterium]
PSLDWSIKTGNGSIYSTVEDLFRWDRALADGKILGRDALREMFKDQGNGVGYGWFVGKGSGRNAVRFNGRSPGYTSYMERYIDDDACIIILSNNYAPVPHVAIDGLRAILFGEPYKTFETDRGFKPEPASFGAFEGAYRFGPDFYRPNAEVGLRVKDESLEIVWTESYVSGLRPLAKAVFLDRLFWATIIFQTDAEGKITGFIWRDTRDYQATKKGDS